MINLIIGMYLQILYQDRCRRDLLFAIYLKFLFVGEILVNTSMTDYTEKYGSQVTLRCSVTYETKIGPVRVNWNKYGQGGHSLVNPAYKGNDHVIFSNYSVSIPGKEGFIMVHHFLTITSLSIEDDARYVCLASSNVSTERSPTIYLKIGG